MKSTYTALTARIAKLQAQADQAKANEKAGVIERIRVAIDAYGITSADLFGSNNQVVQEVRYSDTKATKASPAKRKAKKQGKAYANAGGDTWGGLGPRPAWLRDAIAGGRKLEEFRV